MVAAFPLHEDPELVPTSPGYNRMSRTQLPPLQRPALVFVPSIDRWQDYGRYFPGRHVHYLSP